VAQSQEVVMGCKAKSSGTRIGLTMATQVPPGPSRGLGYDVARLGVQASDGI
jgi:hypothetical protein